MTGLNYREVWEDLPLVDAYGLHHQSLIAAGLATDWPQRRASQTQEIQEIMADLFGPLT